MDPFVLDAQTWATTQFAAADLHDKRRTLRLILLATQITAHPSGSFPEQTESWNDLRAAYNLFDTEEVTFQAIATPHWELTKGTKGKRLLIIEDTTEIDYGPTAQVTGLSPVGSGIGQGFHLHSGLMVSTEDDRVHGLAGQLIYHRQPVPKEEKRIERLKRDDRESQIWSQLVNQIGSPPSGTCWVHVVDRGADDFEFFNSLPANRNRLGGASQKHDPKYHHAGARQNGAGVLCTHTSGSRYVHVETACTAQATGPEC